MRLNPWIRKHNVRIPSPTSLISDLVPTHTLSSDFFPALYQSFIDEPVPLQKDCWFFLGINICGLDRLWQVNALT